MIIKIVCAGVNEFTKLYKEDAQEMLVGVDGGIYEIVRVGKRVDLAIGDFDSCNIEEVVMHCEKIRVFPKEKDYGDLELAIMEVINLDFEKIEIYNVTGGRLDHYQASLNILSKYSNYNLEIIDLRNTIRVIKDTYEIEEEGDLNYSLFAIDEGLRVTLTGFKYNLDNYLLNKCDNLILSNRVEFNRAKIELNGKRAFLFKSK